MDWLAEAQETLRQAHNLNNMTLVQVAQAQAMIAIAEELRSLNEREEYEQEYQDVRRAQFDRVQETLHNMRQDMRTDG